MKRFYPASFLLLVLSVAAPLDAEPWQAIERQLPPPGISIAAEDRARLADELQRLDQRIQQFAATQKAPAARPPITDVEIFYKAVRFAVDQGEFYRPEDVTFAEALLTEAHTRLEDLEAGRHPWTAARGLVVRGYRSTIDDSVQPYGLFIPENLDLSRPVPLYVWLHGRNERLTDLQFIHERQRQIGQLRPSDAIVLHPFGRNCLGWKSVAEVDVLEAICAVSEQYAIDPDRIALLGFSMGGAGAWHLGAHYADRWAAVHAGAGFVDVARYNRLGAIDDIPSYERKLWGLYDVPDYARNLLNVPIVAYSGELDKQKDAADFMAEVFQAHGQNLTHLIGPAMGHEYHEATWQEIVARMHAAVVKGRDRSPSTISLQTRTLRYNRLHWVEALGISEHWRDARIDAQYIAPNVLRLETRNITALRLSPPARLTSLSIDAQPVPLAEPPLNYERCRDRWVAARPIAEPAVLRKKPGLQGPIDDALMEPFMVVLPSGTSPHADVQRWIGFEWSHFRERWRCVYRGDLRIKRDVELTADDIARFHLIAWGDPSSNAIIRRVADKLPIRWTNESLEAGLIKFDAQRHVPLLIYPNPLNPARYLVLNSGPTHREAHDRTNSLQNPKLPDWAIVDVTVAPDARRPGGVVAADFFDEQWQIRSRMPAQDGEFRKP